MDTFAFPDSPVGEIATRTELPHSYVSAIVARLRDLGAFETRADPNDRRRTLVKVSDSVPPAVAGFGATPVDELLTEALGEVPGVKLAQLNGVRSEENRDLELALRVAEWTPVDIAELRRWLRIATVHRSFLFEHQDEFLTVTVTCSTCFGPRGAQH